MWQPGKGDLETGNSNALYPGMVENAELRWAFIRKIYSIVAIQLLLTAMVAAVIVFVRPIAIFFAKTPAGFLLYIVILIIPFIVLFPLYHYHDRHPLNLFLLGLFTVTLSFGVGMSCAFTKGKIILEAAILTAVVAVSLTQYTFWAAKRGHDFSFLGPFLFAAIILLMVFGLIQMLFPLGRTGVMIYALLGALIFSAYIVYDTDNIIKRFSYDEYIIASVSLYLDIINLFLNLLTILRELDG